VHLLVHVQPPFRHVHPVALRTLVLLLHVTALVREKVASEAMLVQKRLLAMIANVSDSFVARRVMILELDHRVETLVALIALHFEVLYVAGFVVPQ
jgi:hypothetical protein